MLATRRDRSRRSSRGEQHGRGGGARRVPRLGGCRCPLRSPAGAPDDRAVRRSEGGRRRGQRACRDPHRCLITQLQAFDGTRSASTCASAGRRGSTARCRRAARSAVSASSLLREIGGWDSELAEDADLSLRIARPAIASGSTPEAVGVLTDPPLELRSLLRRRTRWPRWLPQLLLVKHFRLMRTGVARLWWFAPRAVDRVHRHRPRHRGLPLLPDLDAHRLAVDALLVSSPRS